MKNKFLKKIIIICVIFLYDFFLMYLCIKVDIFRSFVLDFINLMKNDEIGEAIFGIVFVIIPNSLIFYFANSKFEGSKMIFINSEKTYYNSFNFLISKYGYELKYKNTEKGLFYSSFILQKENSPDLMVEIERGYLVLFISIGEEKWSLPDLYKFLHHDKVVRGNFSNSDLIKKYFEESSSKYLDEVLKNYDSLKNDEIERFYKEFPTYVFRWL